MKRIYMRTNPNSYPIIVSQEDSGHFRVQYGEELLVGADYERASSELGRVIFHALSCEGKIRDE